MKNALTSLALVLTSSFLAVTLYAAAPVVDESENYALLNDESPSVSHHQPSVDNEEEVALVKNDTRDNHSAVDLVNQLKGLQQDIQELRGQLELQAHELTLLKQQQLSFYKDLDSRLKIKSPVATQTTHTGAKNEDLELSLESDSVAAASSNSKSLPLTPVATSTKSNPADEQISYLAAYELVKNKQFDDALVAMQQFVTRFPKGGYTANAHYWLGELYMVKKNYPAAIAHFETVLHQFPSSSKSAPCSLKIGYALAASGRESEAKKRLTQVIKKYPDTPTAQLASIKLHTL